MNTIVLQDPLFLVMLGFGLAMAVVVVLLALTRASRHLPPGYTPLVAYPSEAPDGGLGAGCLFFPLLITGIAILLALLSS